MGEVKTDLVVTGYIFNEDKLLLIHHNKLNLWLPVGGHMEQNENMDEALRREVKEETNLEIEFLQSAPIPLSGNTHTNLSNPFHVSMHSVGDHDHCSLFYICKAKNIGSLSINKELKNYKWVKQEDLNDNSIPKDVQHIAKIAFEQYNSN